MHGLCLLHCHPLHNAHYNVAPIFVMVMDSFVLNLSLMETVKTIVIDAACTDDGLYSICASLLLLVIRSFTFL